MVVTGTVTETLLGPDADSLVTTAQPEIHIGFEGVLGANLVVGGIPHLTRIPTGSRMFFPDGAALAIEGENLPCSGPGRIIAAHHPGLSASLFPKAALHLRGLVAWVERPGVIHAGDRVEIKVAEVNPYPG